MQKDKKNILIFIVVLLIIIFISYFMFKSGTTSKIKGSLDGLTASVVEANPSDLPIINFVVNSSGEQFVNTDVAITINASSKYNINKVEYSYDLKNWKEVKEKINNKEINAKIIFTKTMNKQLYIKVTNEKGYSSYAYETKVKIDKENPLLNYDKDGSDIIINASDNIKLSTIQYSNDKISWDEEEFSGKSIILRKKDFKYKYIRVVDSVGNVSKIKEVK